jgi:hypothetical protein
MRCCGARTAELHGISENISTRVRVAIFAIPLQ